MAHYTVDVTMTRYMHADSERDARARARCGVAVQVGSAVGIRSTWHGGTTAETYQHHGAGNDLWRVRLWFRVAVNASDLEAAREIAHHAVQLETTRGYDIFEPEMTVGEPESATLHRAG